jgi:hypothetical protein
VDELPPEVTSLDVEYDNGVSFIGYKLLHDKLEEPLGAQSLVLYLQTEKKLERSYRLNLRTERRRADGTTKVKRESHLPGDWVYPTTLWTPGEIVQDIFVYRIRQRAPGTVEISVALHDGDKVLVPKRSDVTLIDGAYVPLGISRFSSQTRPAMAYLLEYRKRRSTAR